MSHIQFANRNLSVGKVLCVGRNYVEHIQELHNSIPEQMVLFHKPRQRLHRSCAPFIKSLCIMKQRSVFWSKRGNMSRWELA